MLCITYNFNDIDQRISRVQLFSYKYESKSAFLQYLAELYIFQDVVFC